MEVERRLGPPPTDWKRSLPIEGPWLLPRLQHGVHGAPVYPAGVVVENDIGRASGPFLPSPDLDVLHIAGDQMSQQIAHGPVRTRRRRRVLIRRCRTDECSGADRGAAIEIDNVHPTGHLNIWLYGRLDQNDPDDGEARRAPPSAQAIPGLLVVPRSSPSSKRTDVSGL